jgi:hypothetical protein
MNHKKTEANLNQTRSLVIWGEPLAVRDGDYTDEEELHCLPGVDMACPAAEDTKGGFAECETVLTVAV